MTAVVLVQPIQMTLRLRPPRIRTETLSSIQPVHDEDVKIKKWMRYADVIQSNLETIELSQYKSTHSRSDYLKKVFSKKPPFPLSLQDTDTAYLFFWATYLIARGDPSYEEFNELGNPEEWANLLDFANAQTENFLVKHPELDNPQYLPSIQLTAMIVVLKCQFDLRIWNIDVLRAIHFLGAAKTDFPNLMYMNDILPSPHITGISLTHLHKMERIFLKTINHQLTRTL